MSTGRPRRSRRSSASAFPRSRWPQATSARPRWRERSTHRSAAGRSKRTRHRRPRAPLRSRNPYRDAGRVSCSRSRPSRARDRRCERHPAHGLLRLRHDDQPFETPDRARIEILRARCDAPRELFARVARYVLKFAQAAALHDLPEHARVFGGHGFEHEPRGRDPFHGASSASANASTAENPPALGALSKTNEVARAREECGRRVVRGHREDRAPATQRQIDRAVGAARDPLDRTGDRRFHRAGRKRDGAPEKRGVLRECVGLRRRIRARADHDVSVLRLHQGHRLVFPRFGDERYHPRILTVRVVEERLRRDQLSLAHDRVRSDRILRAARVELAARGRVVGHLAAHRIHVREAGHRLVARRRRVVHEPHEARAREEAEDLVARRHVHVAFHEQIIPQPVHELAEPRVVVEREVGRIDAAHPRRQRGRVARSTRRIVPLAGSTMATPVTFVPLQPIVGRPSVERYCGFPASSSCSVVSRICSVP